MPSGPLNGIVLAGGSSRRMGQNKALIEILGVPLLITQVLKLYALFEQQTSFEILVSVRQSGQLDLPEHARYVEDLRPDEGPMMGLYTCLQECAAGHVVVLGVDMPRMDAPILRELIDLCEPGVGVIPAYRNSAFFEPLAAVYPVEILPLVGRWLDAGKRSMQELIPEAIREGLLKQFEIRPVDASRFMNVNCPKDWVDYGDGSG